MKPPAPHTTARFIELLPPMVEPHTLEGGGVSEIYASGPHHRGEPFEASLGGQDMCTVPLRDLAVLRRVAEVREAHSVALSQQIDSVRNVHRSARVRSITQPQSSR